MALFVGFCSASRGIPRKIRAQNNVSGARVGGFAAPGLTSLQLHAVVFGSLSSTTASTGKETRTDSTCPPGCSMRPFLLADMQISTLRGALTPGSCDESVQQAVVRAFRAHNPSDPAHCRAP